ncbi:MAG TPA: DUF4124 domain-containing protein [Geobacteraceae bacterium]|nr:DUF4124 domain-containing protein [Geobacteraceae bacterium]
MKQKVFACIVMLLGIVAGTACAETYSWEDSNGTIHFTEDISQVPKKYLKKVRVRGDMGVAVTPQPLVEQTAETSAPGDTASVGSSPVKEQAAAGEKKEELYGGKSGKSWKIDFDTLRAEIGAIDDQVAELNSRLDDTSKMSRIEYLSIQNTIKNLKFRRGDLEKKLAALNDQAARAGVPAQFR